MMGKVKDLVVVTGTYTNREGVEKKNYKTIGALMESQNGQYLMIDRTFNPAGVPAKDGSPSIMVSLYDPKDGDAPRATAHDKAKASAYQAQRSMDNDLSDNIPF